VARIDTALPNPMLEGGRITWRALGMSVRGSSHERTGLPNQDAIAFEPAADQPAPYAILVVSDGHGDPTCFRSAAGSAFAVRSARDVLNRFRIARERDLRAPTNLIARDILTAWRKLVDDDRAARPFAAEEFARAERLHGPDAHAEIDANPQLAYGATLLAALVTNDYCLYVQIGDGDLLVLDFGGATRRVFAPDSAVTTTTTYSLCLPDAELRFHVNLEPIANRPPTLVLATTDGYANSFGRDADFLKIARDYQSLIEEHGIATVQARLETLLRDASTAGSQDDITLGILSRVGAPAPTRADAALRPAAPPPAVPAPGPAVPEHSAQWQVVSIALVLLLVAVVSRPSIQQWLPHQKAPGPPPPIFRGVPVPPRASSFESAQRALTRNDGLAYARQGRWTEAALAFRVAGSKVPSEAAFDAEAALFATVVAAIVDIENVQGLSVPEAAACPKAALVVELVDSMRINENKRLLTYGDAGRMVRLCGSPKPDVANPSAFDHLRQLKNKIEIKKKIEPIPIPGSGPLSGSGTLPGKAQ
jgi:serine/threonine protein phosphatase PrpC